MERGRVGIKPVIPKIGILFSQKEDFTEIACKPKLLPLKSLNLEKLEKMERELINQNRIITEEEYRSNLIK